jgi:hypothetical protein
MFFALLLQTLILIVVVAISWIWMGMIVGWGMGYGVLVALLNSAMLVVRWHVGLKDFHCNGERHLKQFHRSILERFFVVSLLMAVGFGLLSLEPGATLIGFIVGQLTWVFANVISRQRS